MPAPPNLPRYQQDLTELTICAEIATRLGDLLDDARADHQPRNFAERYLVDELALSQWRRFRAGVMQKAVYEHEEATFQVRATNDREGQTLEPHEDMFHMAMAHAADRHAVVLTALSRLEARYHREFCTTLRLLIALRRGTAPPEANPAASDSRSASSPNEPTNKEPNISERTGRKCEPSSNSSLSTQ